MTPAPDDSGAARGGGVPIPIDEVQAYQACGWTLIGPIPGVDDRVLMQPPFFEDAA